MQPLMILPILLGSLIAYWESGIFSWGKYILGQAIVSVLLMAATYANEYADIETDRLNRTYASFSGGSRVVVDGLIARSILLKVAWINLIVAGFLTLILFISYEVRVSLLILLLLGAIAGIEYSLPPLKLSYRGLGELTVTLFNSLPPLLYGYWLQTELNPKELLWFLSLPLALIVFGGISLSQIPDYASDKIAGKRTLAVRFGREKVFKLSTSTFIIGYIVLVAYLVFTVMPQVIVVLILLSIPITGRLIWLLLKASGGEAQNLELVGGLAISLSIWFFIASIIGLLILKFWR